MPLSREDLNFILQVVLCSNRRLCIIGIFVFSIDLVCRPHSGVIVGAVATARVGGELQWLDALLPRKLEQAESRREDDDEGGNNGGGPDDGDREAVVAGFDGSNADGGVNDDIAALMIFFYETGGPSWRRKDGWLTKKPLTQWHGVTTDPATGRVQRLDLNDNGLSGRVPPTLGALVSSLLNVSYNMYIDIDIDLMVASAPFQ